MDALTSSLAVLTAMITPAVLISASGTMILSTSSRLGRVVDRVRSLSDRLRRLTDEEDRAASDDPGYYRQQFHAPIADAEQFED